MSFLPLHFPPDNKAPQTSGLKKHKITITKGGGEKSLLFASNGSASAKSPHGVGK